MNLFCGPSYNVFETRTNENMKHSSQKLTWAPILGTDPIKAAKTTYDFTTVSILASVWGEVHMQGVTPHLKSWIWATPYG